MKHTEATLEQAITESLVLQGGYRHGNSINFNRQLALDIPTVIEFLSSTQQKEWNRLREIHGDKVETNLVNRLVKELDLRGSLDVLRKGITDFGVKFKLAYFRPEMSINTTAKGLYDSNILTISRQVR